MKVLENELKETLQEARRKFRTDPKLLKVAKEYAIEVIGISKIRLFTGYSVTFNGLLIELSKKVSGEIVVEVLETEES